MERYEAYRDSGVEWVGEVPASWVVQRFRWTLERVNRLPLADDEIITCFRDGEVTLRSNRREDGFTMSDKEIGYQHICAGDFVIHGMDGFAGAMGISDSDGKASPVLMVFRPIGNHDLRYINYLLRLYAWRNVFLSLSTTIRVRSCDLNWAKVAPLPMVLPNHKEQQAIADYLDAKTAEIDALVADCEREVGLLREYRKAVISEAVTKGLDPDASMKDSGVEWIGEIPQKWLVAPLKHIVVSIESGTSLDGASWPASENEKGVLTLSAVYQSRFDATQNKAVSPELYERLSCPLRSGTLLISRCNTSEWVGTAAYVRNAPNNLFLPDKLWQLSFASDFVCRFIQYALQANAARNYFAALSVGASSTMQNIAKSDLLATPIAMPNDNEVAETVAYLDSKTAEIDSLIEAKQSMADKLREYRRSLISEAVTGKFKVPGA